MRDINQEIHDELKELFRLGNYKEFMRRVEGTQFDIAGSFQTERQPFLHLAAKCDEPELAAFLIQKGFDIGRQDFDGDTPLHLACYYSSEKAAEFLIKKNAPLNEGNNMGDTPLHQAIYGQNLNLVRLLIRAGANVTLKNLINTIETGELTPIELAEWEANKSSEAKDIHEYFQGSVEYYMDYYLSLKIQHSLNMDEFKKAPLKFVKPIGDYSVLDVLILEGATEKLLNRPDDRQVFIKMFENSATDYTMRILDATGDFNSLLVYDLSLIHI